MDQDPSLTTNKYSPEGISSLELLGVTRLLIKNTQLYVEHLIETGSAGDTIALHESDVNEFIKYFYEVATLQLSESVIDQRLFGKGESSPEPLRTLTAIDTELAAWERGGIVTSQHEPLREFATWLLDAHRVIINENVNDDGLARCLERGVVTATVRLELQQA
jgi:hypothetical protein